MCGRKLRRFLKWWCSSKCYKEYKESMVKIPIIGEIKNKQIKYYE